jgi:hypothetical protein
MGSILENRSTIGTFYCLQTSIPSPRDSIPGGGWHFFSFSTASRPALEPTQPPIQWVPEVLSLGVKRPGREAHHSPPSSADVNECVGLYLHSPHMSPWSSA